METYNTEEEQVEALRRWWNENGKSVIAGVVLAVGISGGWQYWQGYSAGQAAQASDLYQAMLTDVTDETISPEQRTAALDKAELLKSQHTTTAYAQFSALHLARLAVQTGNLEAAEAELRWVLETSRPGPDVKQITQLRLARILAARGEGEQALGLLAPGDGGSYAASYAVARGDVLMQLNREDEAREAYESARLLAAQQGNPLPLSTLEQKLQGLNPIPARETALSAAPADAGDEG